MVRNVRFAILATAAVVFASTAVNAGSLNSYNSSATPVVSYSAAPEPTLQAPYYDPAPVVTEVNVPQDGFYDESKGSNADFGYSQSHACGGALDGATCLVILNDHMRRVRLDRPAGTILVGNPAIADVTVLGKDTVFVSARSIGSTNIIALDDNNNEIRTFEVFVREPKTKRVVLRNAGQAEHYQCAPDCLRALTQSDAPGPHSTTASVISTDLGVDQRAIGLQSGPNPNQEPQKPAAAPAAAPNPAAPAAAGAPSAGLAGSVGQLGAAVEPAVGALGALVGGGAPAGPVNTAPPPVVAQ